MDPGMQARLARANAVYQGVDENAPDGPPVGVYQMQLRSAAFGESNKGNLMIRWTWVILSGEHLGVDVSDISALESEHPFPHKQLKKRMARLGFEPCVNTWDYQEVCPQITQMAPTITGGLTYRDDFQQVEIIELLQTSSPTAAPAAAPVPAASAVALPVAAPIPQTAAPAPVPAATAVPAVPVVPDEVGIGDTVRYVDPDSGQAYDGLADKINAGVVTVALDADRQFDAPAESLTVLAKADQPVVGVPVMPTVPAPAGALTVDDVLRGDLLVIAKSFAFQANDLNSIEDLTGTLGESEWVEGGEDGLSATEATTLRSVGIPVAVAAPAVPAPTPPPPPPPPALAPAPAPKPKAAKKKAKKKAAKRKKRA